jgi:predicted MFS family arabinose efflux permease
MHERDGGPILLALGGCLAMAAAMGIGRFIYTPILPFMAEALNLTKTEAGLIASANFLGYLAGALAAAGSLIGGDPRRWFLGALAASTLTSAAMAWTGAFALFVTLRFAGGLASAFVLVFSSSLILERLAAAGRAGLSGLHFAGVGTGIAVSSVIVFALGRAPADWPDLWLAGAGFSLACLILAGLLVPPAPPPAAGTASRGDAERGRFRPDATLLRLIFAYGLFGFGYVITATFISTIVRESEAIRHLEPLVWLTVGLAAMPSVLVWNRIGGALGNARAYAVACLVQAAGVALSVASGAGSALVVSAALLGGTFMGLTALGLVEARRLAPETPRRAIALMTAAFGLGQMVGPFVAGLGYDITGSFAVPSLLAVLALIVAAALTVRIGSG